LNVLKITKKDLEVFGSASLEGMIFNAFGEIPPQLRIEFEQKLRKGEPDIILIPEFVPVVLVESIINLAKKCELEVGGYEV
jgi:hypothetical protein